MTIINTWKKSMAAKLQVLIDLNVILDVLQRREPFYEMSASVLANIETGQVVGWVAAHSLTTLFYLLAKHHSANHARVALTEILNLLSVAAVDQTVIEQALNLPYQDFEDAVQMMAAVQTGADYVITRNPRDYKEGPLPALMPAELLALL
jgi:predicted nucleic acid-binding protein